MRSQMLKAKEAKLPFEQQLKSVTDKIAESETKLSNLRVSLMNDGRVHCACNIEQYKIVLGTIG